MSSWYFFILTYLFHCGILLPKGNNMTLKEYLKNKKIGVTALSRAIGCGQPMCTAWANGRKLPNKENMQKIFLVTGGQVTPNDFYGIGQR